MSEANLHDSLHEATPTEFECMVQTMRFGEEDADLLTCKEELPREPFEPDLPNASQSAKTTLLSNVRERVAATLTAMAALRHMFPPVPI